MSNYFNDCTTTDEITARYKELVKELHPDKGGTVEDFQDMQEEYEQALSEASYQSPFLADEYINVAKSLAGVFKARKPETYNKLAKVAAATPIVLSMLGGNRTTRNIAKFIEKLDL